MKHRNFRNNGNSVLIYRCKTRKVTKRITRDLQTFVNRLRKISEIFWLNVNLKELSMPAQEKSVTVEIELQKWKWPGHTMSKDFSEIEEKTFIWGPQGPCTYLRETEKVLEENSK
jgi:hypothetical protein